MRTHLGDLRSLNESLLPDQVVDFAGKRLSTETVWVGLLQVFLSTKVVSTGQITFGDSVGKLRTKN